MAGAVEKCGVEFSHAMKIERVWEAPRVTKPYTEEQWSAIEQLGHRVDADLVRNDVRLTMGGEPTFVSADDHEGAEWNTDAVGPTKRLLGAELLARLRDHFAPEGLLHYGQGKWYPGEQLPRWSLACYWRKDGAAIWQDPALQADERKDYGATDAQSERFLQTLARTLGLDPEFVFPPTRTPGTTCGANGACPPMWIRSIRASTIHSSASASGASSPGAWSRRPAMSCRCGSIPRPARAGPRVDGSCASSAATWFPATRPWACACRWTPCRGSSRRTTRGYMRTIPSPASRPLPARTEIAAQRPPGAAVRKERPPGAFESAKQITRTALCAEARHGVLYIFMPPVEAIEDYLDLVDAIESAARELRLPVILEGYGPPRDPGIEVLRITPDPGVLEANIQPAADWKALVENTETLYEAARLTRLTTEKFMLDGRHTGTGGGNHFVLGGATPADSPFLRRPDLLASLIAYWNNHPSLSYLFSGLFLGPTSQHPRIDEARNDSVYEIEIAMRELERLQARGAVGAWTVDRVLRNLLIDAAGNTHRTEFCIDKLYSPDTATGRLGLLELRAFEMPPHARMSLTQQLLLRSLVARFWQSPYRPGRLKRWGTELHDRFMLPHFLWQDFEDVIAEQKAFGYELDAAWFAPHREFRFPRYGEFTELGVHVELRAALEPWHVLGEEGGAGGAVRYVDSSVERLQVHATGLVGDRHVLTCNGRPLPLQPTGDVGEFVAGVRYRAWQAPFSLHPTIGVHAPLVFDLVDTWMQRSLGGCQYHVSHPGGRTYDVFPVNAYEAEGRRLARFFRIGHTPGPMLVRDEPRNPNFPFTLDLRRP